MQIGIIGLGKMGGAIARRLCASDIHVVGLDSDPNAADALKPVPGFEAAYSLDALLLALPAPRMVWCMLPSGAATQLALDDLLHKLSAGDTVIDGGNSYYKESMARAARFAEHGIAFIDAGISGGLGGLENGFAIMMGGSEDTVKMLGRPLDALAPHPQQWLHCGPSGAGHFVKMIHNGIEYGMMQAYAEGLALLQGKREFDLDLPAITSMWEHGSVIRSWLLELITVFLRHDSKLAHVAPLVADSGEGRWTAMESIEQGIPAPVITTALMQRFSSQGHDDFAAKLLAMMRKSFGGHGIETKKA
jgi:6-phosphogluconate dehydrogenase